ncbi:uncharacterized protein BKA78DRAFT_100048 [Phyllosticta capitalensis]|uniref:uncharacterized protein n=1 Tax=Phyllosticta capitalensis TaxID=121624 RepID=UPI00312D56F7
MPRLLLSPRSLPPYVLFIALFPLTLLFHKHLPTLGVLLFQQVLFPRPTSSTPPHPPYPPAHLCIFLLERTHLPISYMATLFGRKSETRSKKSLTKRDTRERHNEYHLFHLVHRSPQISRLALHHGCMRSGGGVGSSGPGKPIFAACMRSNGAGPRGQAQPCPAQFVPME